MLLIQQLKTLCISLRLSILKNLVLSDINAVITLRPNSSSETIFRLKLKPTLAQLNHHIKPTLGEYNYEADPLDETHLDAVRRLI